MDLQLRAPDSVVTRKLDNLIDAFVRRNIKLMLLGQLATILISPFNPFSFREEMRKLKEKRKDLLWNESASKPMLPFERLDPLFRSRQTNKNLWLKRLYRLLFPFIILLRPKWLRAIRHRPSRGNIHRNNRDLFGYTCDRFQHLIKRLPQWRLEGESKNGVENDVGFSELRLEGVNVFEDWDIEVFALFDETLEKIFGRRFREVDGWDI